MNPTDTSKQPETRLYDPTKGNDPAVNQAYFESEEHRRWIELCHQSRP